MKTNRFIILTFLTAALGLSVISCADNSRSPLKIPTDTDLTVEVYPYISDDTVNDGSSLCLLKETVHVSELIRYPDDDDITVAFRFADTVRYAEITADNIDKRLTLLVNGRIVSNPVVKMRISGGACSFMLPEDSLRTLLPEADLSPLFPERK